MMEIRPVIAGLSLGLICLLFGILWAVYIAINHENIHRSLEKNERAELVQKFVLSGSTHGERAQAHTNDKAGHDNIMSMDNMADKGQMNMEKEGAVIVGQKAADTDDAHEDPLMEKAHERLTRGHLHAMGLGTVTIGVSLLLVFLSAPRVAKTIASASIGIGGVFYPLSWIIMGYRTPTFGIKAAEESVLPIVGLSILLILTGIVLTLFLVVREVFKRN